MCIRDRRWAHHDIYNEKDYKNDSSIFSPRLFDSEGEGFIPVERFRIILKEVDEDFTEDELDDIIFEVGDGDDDGDGDDNDYDDD